MPTNWRLGLLLPPLALFLIVVFSRPLTHSIDFLVYYHAARVLLTGQGALYGPQSGIGFPQVFRYPPFFLIAFSPIALLPVKAAVILWLALKCTVLYFLLRGLSGCVEFPRQGWWWLIPACICGGFFVQEFRFGNAQFLIFALVVVALWQLRRRPIISAFALALGISLKVWPLFFLPYVVARRHVRVAALTVAFIAGLTLLPSLSFGWEGNLNQLRQWTAQEWGTGSLGEQAWFPSQSLGGVLQRYLTVMDFSRWPDPNYPHTNFAAMDPRLVRAGWLLLTGLAYATLLVLARAAPASLGSLTDALSLGVLPILQPFTYRPEMVVLLWPAMAGGALMAVRKKLPKPALFLICAAVLIEAAEPLIPGAKSQRFLQAVGIDFWATCFLTAGLLVIWLRWRESSEFAPFPAAASGEREITDRPVMRRSQFLSRRQVNTAFTP